MSKLSSFFVTRLFSRLLINIVRY